MIRQTYSVAALLPFLFVATTARGQDRFWPAVPPEAVLVRTEFAAGLEGWTSEKCRRPADGVNGYQWLETYDGALGVLQVGGLPLPSGQRHQIAERFRIDSTAPLITLITRFKSQGGVGFVWREPDQIQISRMNLGYMQVGHYEYSYDSPRERPVLPPTFDRDQWNQLVMVIDRPANRAKFHNLSEATGEWQSDGQWYVFNRDNLDVSWGYINIDNEARGGTIYVDHFMMVEGAYPPRSSADGGLEDAATGDAESDADTSVDDLDGGDSLVEPVDADAADGQSDDSATVVGAGNGCWCQQSSGPGTDLVWLALLCGGIHCWRRRLWTSLFRRAGP